MKLSRRCALTMVWMFRDLHLPLPRQLARDGGSASPHPRRSLAVWGWGVDRELKAKVRVRVDGMLVSLCRRLFVQTRTANGAGLYVHGILVAILAQDTLFLCTMSPLSSYYVVSSFCGTPPSRGPREKGQVRSGLGGFGQCRVALMVYVSGNEPSFCATTRSRRPTRLRLVARRSLAVRDWLANRELCAKLTV